MSSQRVRPQTLAERVVADKGEGQTGLSVEGGNIVRLSPLC